MNNWNVFTAINDQRRSIRDFDGIQVPDEDVEAILKEAGLAPSSANAQPYQLHWIKTAEMKEKIALACNGQRAAASASTIIVLVASTSSAKVTLKQMKLHVDRSKVLSDKSKAYHTKTVNTMTKFLKVGPLVIWTPLLNLVSLVVPSISILPFGGIGVRNWAAKNATFAAQNLMLAATAKGYDTCPMEGFNAVKIASLLQLPYGSVIPVVIALGKRTVDAHLEPQWRKPFEELVVVH